MLARDAAYEGLPYRRRRELHARVGEELEARAGCGYRRRGGAALAPLLPRASLRQGLGLLAHRGRARARHLGERRRRCVLRARAGDRAPSRRGDKGRSGHRRGGARGRPLARRGSSSPPTSRSGEARTLVRGDVLAEARIVLKQAAILSAPARPLHAGDPLAQARGAAARAGEHASTPGKPARGDVRVASVDPELPGPLPRRPRLVPAGDRGSRALGRAACPCPRLLPARLGVRRPREAAEATLLGACPRDLRGARRPSARGGRLEQPGCVRVPGGALERRAGALRARPRAARAHRRSRARRERDAQHRRDLHRPGAARGGGAAGAGGAARLEGGEPARERRLRHTAARRVQRRGRAATRRRSDSSRRRARRCWRPARRETPTRPTPPSRNASCSRAGPRRRSSGSGLRSRARRAPVGSSFRS